MTRCNTTNHALHEGCHVTHDVNGSLDNNGDQPMILALVIRMPNNSEAKKYFRVGRPLSIDLFYE